jgi:hypothetical protein
VAKAEDVLRLPAAALRFRPEMLGLPVVGAHGNAPSSPPARGRFASGGGQRGSFGPATQKKKAEGNWATVYVPAEKPSSAVLPVRIRPGLTDGQYVEVREGELAEGQRVVVGLATAQAEEAGGLAGMTRMGPPRR